MKCCDVAQIVNNCLQDPSAYKLVYPHDADNIALSAHPLTECGHITDVLSSLHDLETCQLVELLAALEEFQVLLAKAKVLNREEDIAVDSEYTTLFRLTPRNAGLAAVLIDLAKASTKFIHMKSGTKLPDELEERYMFADMLEVLPQLVKAETDCAVSRWGSAVIRMEIRMVGASPVNWKKESLDDYNADWVKENLLIQKLLQNLGSHHLHVTKWVTNLKRDFSALYHKLEATLIPLILLIHTKPEPTKQQTMINTTMKHKGSSREMRFCCGRRSVGQRQYRGHGVGLPRLAAQDAEVQGQTGEKGPGEVLEGEAA